ncbi:hypothetical protein GCM10011371_21990 [Novosphingobium marinum]|uniref:SnoaL-like domain-containing protein n=1 Tax=Novosphingobium marinum TaxID=1514948 RepID=A0A7Y9Y085_9SPHN|nr:nuclear transport factor 2 family protein [Novosphingobium marinum]NYH96313.1 hypothetical protein [Novosphingobium marinum]GGC34259.1 hypothetical protein GCM10011371_21990 [Novosphingobium marinum]
MNGEIEAQLRSLEDRQAIAALLNGYSYGIDLRDWSLYRSIFADSIAADFAWSGVNQSFDADEWVALVCSTLAPFDATQHSMTNIDIDLNGDEATLRCQMSARHVLVLDGAEHHHMIGGHYVHDVVRTGTGWKIRRLCLTITWEQGDVGLFERAAALGPRPRASIGEQGMVLPPEIPSRPTQEQ